MAQVMSLLAIVAGIGSLVCWIIVLVKMFQNSQILLGIVSILCGLVAFIMGWVNAKQWNIQNVMLIWTACIVVGIIANLMGGGFAMVPQVQP